ncbi:amidohydrolase [Lentisalinibacter sediminis]|uniref:amidohydrolase n=1 Tax=Lentisalinibacter sediminis TaxID=2992237 RepID=UPI00386C1721
MRATLLAAALLLLQVGCAERPAGEAAGEAPGVEPADIVFTGGAIHIADENRSRAEAVAVRGDTIVAVGGVGEVSAWIGNATRVVDLDGRTVLPGFHDAHMHPITGGEMLLGCSLFGLTTRDAILAKVAECVAESDEEWVIGENFDLAAFPGGNPHKSLLDEIAPDRYVYLRGTDGHNDLANSKVLELAGITAETPDPPKGVIERDPETGAPTGMLRETARAPVEALLPETTFEDRVAALEATLAETTRYGITSLVDAWTGVPDWEVYRAVAEAGGLDARVKASLTYGVNAKHQGEEWESALARRDEFTGERFSVSSVKFFVDGVLEGETAALVEPYTGMDHRGVLNFESDELKEAVTRFDAMGLQIHMHAIGDLAVREGLDAIEAARKTNGDTGNRHHITHLQLVHPDDIPRFAELGVAASFQALWAYPDAWIMEINLPVVGPQRVQRMYPIGSIHRAGGTIVGSSDWAVSSMNPLEAIETAITRQDASGQVEGTLNADEAVDLATMLDAYTRNAARLLGHDDITGSIETGKRADIVVLDRDIFAIPAEELSEVRVDMTLLDGRIVYEREEAPVAGALAENGN